MKLVSVALISVCVLLPGMSLAESALNRATTQCMFEVDNSSQIHVTLTQKRDGTEKLRVKNKETGRSSNDPVIDAYMACVSAKVGQPISATATVQADRPVVAADASASDARASGAQPVVQQVRTCMVQTRAPGSYGVFVSRPVPVVQAELGGTERGARHVNDCLQDRYSVQYSLLETGTVASAESVSAQPAIAANACPRHAGVLYAGSGYCR